MTFFSSAYNLINHKIILSFTVISYVIYYMPSNFGQKKET